MYPCLVLLQLIISFSLTNKINAFQGEIILQSHYDTFDVNSFLSTSCNASVPHFQEDNNNRPASLKVSHMHGECQNDDIVVPSLSEILTDDENRVASKGISITTRSGNYYVVTVGIGTPAQYLTLAIDTGSSLSWTQCKPCSGHCYKQKDPVFDPLHSTSYSNVSCITEECDELLYDPSFEHDCADKLTCVYGTTSVSKSYYSKGFLANERLTLTAHDVFDDFAIGCGQNNSGLFGDSAGLLGLGLSPRTLLSLVSTTASKYGKYFSYCLPTKSGSNGHLTFGKSLPKNPFVFTPLGGGAAYSVDIVAIHVAGRQLNVSLSVFQSGGAIIDSGTIITRLPPTAYTALRDAFRQQMSEYKSAPAVSILDTCYDLSNHTTVTIPMISFIFRGNAKVDLGSKGVLINDVGKSKWIFCLAFAANKADNDLAIFGNVQQQTFEVSYDVAAGRLGFSPGGCS